MKVGIGQKNPCQNIFLTSPRGFSPFKHMETLELTSHHKFTLLKGFMIHFWILLFI